MIRTAISRRPPYLVEKLNDIYENTHTIKKKLNLPSIISISILSLFLLVSLSFPYCLFFYSLTFDVAFFFLYLYPLIPTHYL
ncbi:hypothetical protein F4810DRAFT_489680 [Camillea tinctor]|nr:hypothetical protein F4810DRAFT_489680 [Camillea tinctor]